MKPIFTQYILLLFLLVLQLSLFAQGIEGTVIDQEGEPLPFASIFIVNLKNGSSCNAYGQYKLNLPTGTHTVQVKYIGYETQQVQLLLREVC
ncbi:carboxypeptidase-like regulatory domain-containing protein [Pontibacter toksunensis]|uniref:Carboxypeptidase-like regulatory domain-containing protein n=1 Tax=Pontibacter toksunensis TaxID=1332631 RepID=A0ABW6BRU5_9BACT